MTIPKETTDQQQNGTAQIAGSSAIEESLGDQLLREAQEGQAEFAAEWTRFMEEQGFNGKPISAQELRELALQEGINPQDNQFSRGIAAMREE
jgi:hypothetical protein